MIDNLSNPQLVTMAVALLGGDSDYCDREDIAIKVNEIASKRFTWRKYPERIDLSAVGTALRDAKKSKNGELLTGNNTQGWMLTRNGIQWVKTLNLDSFISEAALKHRRNSITANQEAECQRLRRTEAYKLYIAGDLDKLSIQEFYQFARVNEYFHAKSKERRFVIIDNAVMDDENLSELWALLKKRFVEEVG